jgi:hypothetical protein
LQLRQLGYKHSTRAIDYLLTSFPFSIRANFSLSLETTMKPPYPAPVTEWHNDTYDAINPQRPELSQAGKIVVITGAGSGIGREIAHAFAEAGASSMHILGRTK